MKTKNIKTKVTDVDAKGIVEIQVSAFNNIDSYGDIMMPTAFNKTIADKFKRVKHLKNHSWELLLGVPLEMTATKQGLTVVSKMNLEKQIVKDTFSDYKFMAENGNTLEHSIGYAEVKTEPSEEGGKAVLLLHEVKLMEYSTLDFLGANEQTPLLNIKSQLNSIELMIKNGDYSDEKCELLLKKYSELVSLINSKEPQSHSLEETKEAQKKQFYLNKIKNGI